MLFMAKGTGYKPRTEQLAEGGRPRFINRLILEGSPYLIQHAHNPVGPGVAVSWDCGRAPRRRARGALGLAS
jgi:hypothetical protein